jgi:ABC-2 type transport system permease protein
VSTTGPRPPEGAEVFDLGYARHDGARTGLWTRRRAIWRDGVRAALGLGRGIGAKVAPWALLALALMPALILSVVSVAADSLGVSEQVDLPSFAEYFEYAVLPSALLAAVVAPELLCADRRQGVIALYAVRPIGPLDYAGARMAAFLTVGALGLWVPQTLLFLTETLQADDPLAWLGDNWDVLPRFLAAGLLMTAVFGSLALLAATFTTRRAFATVGTLAVVFVGSALSGIARSAVSGTPEDVLGLFGLLEVVPGATHWLLGSTPVDAQLGAGVSALWSLVLVAVFTTATALRVRRQALR